jgi:hypothetical protein
MLQTLLVGNGESRLKIKKFPAHDQIIVCNAAYKHFKTDNVVAVDKRMINEALSNSSATVWSRPDCVREYFNNNRVKVLPTIPVPHDERMFKSYNWGSGTSALVLGAKLFGDLSIIGFDFYSHNQYVNNVYKGIKNYSDPTASAIDPEFWIEQTALVLDSFPNIKFTFYVSKELPFPEKLLAKNNLTIDHI